MYIKTRKDIHGVKLLLLLLIRCIKDSDQSAYQIIIWFTARKTT